MCGICGIINLTEPRDLSREVLLFNQLLRHRGPDGEGFLLMKEDGSVVVAGGPDSDPSLQLPMITSQRQRHVAAFGHRRLSIMDRTTGSHQPFSKNGTDWLLFNGAIYNFRSLRSKLEAAGHTFETTGDTEVLWQALMSYGTRCLNELNGMFSFAWWNSLSGRLILSRDRTGVKPLYYALKRGRHFAFASELKALAAAGYHEGINRKAAFEFLWMGLLENDDESLFSGIMELNPGTMLVFDRNSQSLEKKRYHNPDYYPYYNGNQKYEDAVMGCYQRITASIESHLVSEVPIGTCLSGGLDSSSICALANQAEAPNMTKGAFSAIFPGMDEDESKYAHTVAKQYELAWHSVTPEMEGIRNDLEELVYSQDLPLVSTSTYAQHCVMKLASKSKIKVLLDGQGSDELFGGYYRYIPNLWDMLLARGMPGSLMQSIKDFRDIFPARSAIRYLAKHHFIYTLPPRLRCLVEGKMHRELRYLDRDFVTEHLKYLQYESGFVLDNLNAHLFYDYFKGPLKSLLRCEDRASMHFGIEARTPFADDIHLQNYVFCLPASFKMRHGWTKSLLRDAMKNKLPEEIRLRRDKKGFQTPHSSWLAGLAPMSEAYFERLSGEGLLSPMMRTEMRKAADQISRSEILFRFITFGVWMKVFDM